MSHRLSTTNYNHFLDSCIQIDEIRISRRTSIPHKINFHLDLAALKHIEEIRDNNRQLFLSSPKIADLRYCVMLNAFVEQQLILNPHQSKGTLLLRRSPLTFSTKYSGAGVANRQQPKTLFRSAIDFKGKISQQIQQELYQNPQLLTRISQAHYWLIAQIIAQLQFKNNYKYSWLVFSCSSIVAILFGLISWYLFPTSKLFNLMVILTVLWSLNTIFKKLLSDGLKRWIIYHLVAGIFTKNSKNRQFGLWLLNSIIRSD